MSYIKRYLEDFASSLNCDQKTKIELIEEFHDHLLLLKNEYVEQGLSEEHAEKCAVLDFGDRTLLKKEIAKTLNPFNRMLKGTLWLTFSMYVLWMVMVAFIGKFDVMVGNDYDRGVTLRFDWGIYSNHNFIPLKNIHNLNYS